MLHRFLVFFSLTLILCGCSSRKGTVSVNQTDSLATSSLTVAVAAVTQTIESVPAPKEASSTTGLDSSSIETSLAYSLAWVDVGGVLHHSIANKDTIHGALVVRKTFLASAKTDTTRQIVSKQVTLTTPKQTWSNWLWHTSTKVGVGLIVITILLFLFRSSFKPPDLI